MEGLCCLLQERKNAYRVVVGKLAGRVKLKDTGLGGRKILKWIFKNRLRWDGLES